MTVLFVLGLVAGAIVIGHTSNRLPQTMVVIMALLGALTII